MKKPVSAVRGFRAFTLIELLLVIGIIGILVSILLPSLKGARKVARQSVCMSNMRQLAIAQNNYANQYKDLIGTFNRTPPNGADWASESGRQAQEIVQRITGKNATDVPLITNRYFHRNYWHLPAVADGAFGSATGSLISDVVACPEDRVVLEWKKNSNNPAALLIGMSSDGSPGYEKYRPYWSSFQQVPAAWTADTSLNGTRRTVGQSTQHHLFWSSGTAPNALPFGARKLAEVAFPSSKVWMLDLYDRHFYRRMIWHGYKVARQPLVFFDTSVRVYRTRDARNGHVAPDDLFPTSAPINIDTVIGGVTTYNYTPGTGWVGYDPPTLSGAASDQVEGKYRWTYKGLKGWDYLGKQSGTGGS